MRLIKNTIFRFASGPSRPKADPNSHKYGPRGFFDQKEINSEVPDHLGKIISSTANYALARSTWSSYGTSLNMLNRCNEELNLSLRLPMTETDTLIFIGYLLDKNLSAATISSYLAGIRQKQIALGFGGKTLRTPLINQVIDGQRNQQNTEKNLGNGSTRVPVTPKMLLLIKQDLKKSSMGKLKKLLIWSVSTLMFFGAFRGGELLARREKSFDPTTVLLGSDVKLKNLLINNERVQLLQITLKSEKTNRNGSATIVDVYASHNATCPVAAWKKWQTLHNSEPDLPAFMADKESAFTCGMFNKYLANFNQKYLNEPGRTLSCHCFRSGMATLLAKIGFTDAEIMASGRWSSRAFEEYIKMPRSSRLAMSKTIANLNV